jgi:hypothetical protein
MQLAPVADTYVATVNFRGGDWRVSAGAAPSGVPADYASLAAAIAAARTATDGVEVAAAGVFQQGERFVLRSLSSEYRYSTGTGPAEPAVPYTHLEQLVRMFGNDSRLGEIRIGSDPTGATFPTDPTLRAIVDGPALLRL